MSRRELGFDALELQHDLQSGRDLGRILLCLHGARKQRGELTPGELCALLSRQMLLDQHPHVGERRSGHDR